MDTQTKPTEADNSTLSLIYSKYYKKMYTYGLAIGFCKHICNDAAQDVFCTICYSRNKLKSVENIESYLLHCMKNRLFDIYKDEKRKRYTDYDDNTNNSEEFFLDKLIAEENRKIIEKKVDRLLRKLPPKHQKIVLCRFNHNLKYNEIAIIMNMTPDATKKQMYRSLKLMEQEAKSESIEYYNTC